MTSNSAPQPRLSTPRALARLLPFAKPAMPRLIGGAIFFSGMLLMAWNVWQTVRQAKTAEMQAAAQFSVVEGAH